MPEGEAGKFRIADICGHFRTFGEGSGVGMDFEVPVGARQFVSRGLSSHQSPCCLSDFLDLSTSNGTLNMTSNMVQRCYTRWQAGSVSRRWARYKPDSSWPASNQRMRVEIQDLDSLNFLTTLRRWSSLSASTLSSKSVLATGKYFFRFSLKLPSLLKSYISQKSPLVRTP